MIISAAGQQLKDENSFFIFSANSWQSVAKKWVRVSKILIDVAVA